MKMSNPRQIKDTINNLAKRNILAEKVAFFEIETNTSHLYGIMISKSSSNNFLEELS